MTNSPVTIITGGGSGIGAAAARRLLDRGGRVTVLGRGAERLSRLTADLQQPSTLLTHVGDASNFEDVSACVEATVHRFGRLDTVIANAGFAVPGTIITGDPEAWRDMVLTNVLGPALLIRAAHAHLVETRG
ncbi:MAG: SDR family oxidoreductase, partial [Stackebrandtia sp.]